MNAYLLVGLGGAAGSMARYGVSRLLPFAGFPVATLTVNIVGSFLMGLLAASLSGALAGWSEEARLLLGVGLLGGFTTFSAFSLDFVNLMQRGDWMLGLIYIALSVVLSIAALVFGFWIARGVF